MLQASGLARSRRGLALTRTTLWISMVVAAVVVAGAQLADAEEEDAVDD